jgi:hypothetical protein
LIHVSAPEAGGVVTGGGTNVDGVVAVVGWIVGVTPVESVGVVVDVSVSVGDMLVLGNGGRPESVESVWSTDAVGSVGNVSDENVDGAVVSAVGTAAVDLSSLASAYARVPAPIPSTPSPIAKMAIGPSRRRSAGARGVGAPHSRQYCWSSSSGAEHSAHRGATGSGAPWGATPPGATGGRTSVG